MHQGRLIPRWEPRLLGLEAQLPCDCSTGETSRAERNKTPLHSLNILQSSRGPNCKKVALFHDMAKDGHDKRIKKYRTSS